MALVLLALVVMVGAMAVSVLLVPLTHRLARRLGAMDPPGPRKLHTIPTPRLGGVAVFISFTAVVLAGYTLVPVLMELEWARALFAGPLGLLREAPRVKVKLLVLLGGAAACFLVGLADDVFGRRFPVWAKVAGQSAAALALVAADVRISFLPHEWMNVSVTLVWLVGMTNAFNLLDNMDGLAAGVALVASGVLLINAWSLGEFFISLLLLALMGSLLGFLFFNFHPFTLRPASVFLGDCGSLFIGYLMGSLTLLERYVSRASSTLFPVLMPVVVLAVPLIDTFTVVIVRLREGRPFYVGDNCHLSHRLVSLGFSRRSAVLFLHLMTFAMGLGVASLTDATVGQSILVLLQTLGFVVLLLWLMSRRRSERPGGQP